MSHHLISVLVRVSIPMPVPRHLSGRLLGHERALYSFYEWEIAKNLGGGVCLLLGITILSLGLNIPRGLTLATVLVTRILLPKQKATFLDSNVS
jgi:hypothetical protein